MGLMPWFVEFIAFFFLLEKKYFPKFIFTKQHGLTVPDGIFKSFKIGLWWTWFSEVAHIQPCKYFHGCLLPHSYLHNLRQLLSCIRVLPLLLLPSRPKPRLLRTRNPAGPRRGPTWYAAATVRPVYWPPWDSSSTSLSSPFRIRCVENKNWKRMCECFALEWA